MTFVAYFNTYPLSNLLSIFNNRGAGRSKGPTFRQSHNGTFKGLVTRVIMVTNEATGRYAGTSRDVVLSTFYRFENGR